MRELSNLELLNVNGGDSCHPTVSDNEAVQGGYGVGWHIGHAIGETIEDVGDIFEAIGGWFS